MREAARAVEVLARVVEATGGCRGGNVGCSHDVRRAPKEEDVRLLHPEVSDHSPKRHVFERRMFDFSFSCSQGGAHRAPPPRACQGVKVRCGRPYEAALIEGAAGGREHGDGGERGPA
jgi:hypothetical protein